MSIKHKTILIYSLTFIVIIITTIIIFNVSYFGYINKEKEQSMVRNFEVMNSMLEKEEGNLQNLLVDWGQWDDTYEFMNKFNQEYIESNLSENTIEDLNLDNLIYVNNDRQIVYSEEGGMEKEDSQAILKKLLLNNENFNKTNTQRIGLLFLKGKIYMVGVLPITSTGKQLESNGTIIMTREIDDKLLNYIEKIIPVNLMFRETEQEKFEREDDWTYIHTYNGI
ncbi:hypothetical protein psyc5s11_50510 [Clostridium gelidum]|uniref:CHASE4 domain-containing protein n=1 Tax=Clostridium gelidum TaxID=704125 RepID=A0ABN6J3U9_9CLOT|nr:CHASE4 domain-containing protein [Clostridium gelidum]BCZ48984.1 hypothetical protein psyc5s11_50510 [Clostridium gelidum]